MSVIVKKFKEGYIPKNHRNKYSQRNKNQFGTLIQL